MSAGIVLNKKIGDFVKDGELLCTLYTNKTNVEEVIKNVKKAFTIEVEKPQVDESLTHNLIQ